MAISGIEKAAKDNNMHIVICQSAESFKEEESLVKDERIEHCNFTRESEMSAARKLLYAPNYPDGILAFIDQIAINMAL